MGLVVCEGLSFVALCKCCMPMMQIMLLIFFSHVRFRLTEVAKIDPKEVDDFLKANGLDYKPVCKIISQII